MWVAMITASITAALVALLTLNVVQSTSVLAQPMTSDIKLAEPVQIFGDREIFDPNLITEFMLPKQKQQSEVAEQNAYAATTTNIAKNTTLSPAPNIVQPQPQYDRLIIPKIGLNAQLVSVGLMSNGAIDVHPTLPAWFNQSSRAGSNTGRFPATFIDGHRQGIFSALGQLAVGDTITVSFAGGEEYTYTVVKTETRSLDDPNLMPDALSIFGSATQGLNLMTCAGNYLPARSTYDLRLVIYAVR